MIKSLRLVAFIEGLSYLYLLFCSIYLKRMMGDEHAIVIPGGVHGALFVLFGLLLLACWIKEKWSFGFVTAVFISSLIPFGFLWIEPKLKGKEQRAS